MNHSDFTERLNSRSILYPDGRVLNPRHAIALRVDPQFADSYETQIGLIVAVSLLSRMTPNLVLDIPSVPLHKQIPWSHDSFRDVLNERICLDRPDQHIRYRPVRDSDYQLNFGPRGGPVNVHGSGWIGFVGPSNSPLPSKEASNPIGPALASIVAVSRLFDIDPRPITTDVVLDAFGWQTNPVKISDHPELNQSTFGNIWCVGVGSVGSSALFFLALATREFKPVLVDMDEVKIENLDRSPIFRYEHINKTSNMSLKKVDAAEIFLASIGVEGITKECCSFAHSHIRQKRQPNPDLIISAANEENVRYTIEQSLPPIQIYATTGNQWQATLLRHIPLVEACSCCVFPPEEQVAETVCAHGELRVEETGEKIDAALPFLSYMAGLMTAAEILKLSISEYPFSRHNKVTFRSPSPNKKDPDFFPQIFGKQSNCVCQTRHQDIHREMISTSMHASLSD